MITFLYAAEAATVNVNAQTVETAIASKIIGGPSSVVQNDVATVNAVAGIIASTLPAGSTSSPVAVAAAATGTAALYTIEDIMQVVNAVIGMRNNGANPGAVNQTAAAVSNLETQITADTQVIKQDEKVVASCWCFGKKAKKAAPVVASSSTSTSSTVVAPK